MSVSAVEPPPEAFNFAAHLLGANVGRPGKAAFVDDSGSGHLRRARRARPAVRRGPQGARRQARGARAPIDAGRRRLAGRLLGRDAGGRHSGGGQHAAYRRRSRLHARALARPGRFRQRRGEAGAQGRDDQVGSRGPHRRRVAPGPAARLRRGRVRGLPRPRGAAHEARPHPRRRSRLLALFVRLDRPAEGDGSFARQSLLDDRTLRQADPGPEGERHLLLRRQAFLRLRARQCADLSA